MRMMRRGGIGRGWARGGWQRLPLGVCGLMTGLAQGQGASAVLMPPAGSVAYLTAHATGTQNYVCLPATTNGVAKHSVDVCRSAGDVDRAPPRVVATGSDALSEPGADGCTDGEAGMHAFGGRQGRCTARRGRARLIRARCGGTKLASVTAGTDASCPTTGGDSVPAAAGGWRTGRGRSMRGCLRGRRTSSG